MDQGGFGFGWRRFGWQAANPEDEVQWLKGYAANLERALEEVRNEIASLERDASQEQPTS